MQGPTSPPWQGHHLERKHVSPDLAGRDAITSRQGQGISAVPVNSSAPCLCTMAAWHAHPTCRLCMLLTVLQSTMSLTELPMPHRSRTSKAVSASASSTKSSMSLRRLHGNARYCWIKPHGVAWNSMAWHGTAKHGMAQLFPRTWPQQEVSPCVPATAMTSDLALAGCTSE